MTLRARISELERAPCGSGGDEHGRGTSFQTDEFVNASGAGSRVHIQFPVITRARALAREVATT